MTTNSQGGSSSLWLFTQDADHMRTDGRGDHASHSYVVDWLERDFGGAPFSMLDCGVMSGVTYERAREKGLAMTYTGIDISPTIVRDCQARHPDAFWEEMSATDLRYRSNSFDVANCRHLLECLPYYETAVRELFRVARSRVSICMGQVPMSPELLLRRETPDGYIWFNRYDPGPLEELLHMLSTDVLSVDVGVAPRVDRVYICEKRPPRPDSERSSWPVPRPPR